MDLEREFPPEPVKKCHTSAADSGSAERLRQLGSLLFAPVPVALAAVVLFGVIARLRALLSARSLWLDEVSIAWSIRERGFIGLLTEPLDFGQSAAPGFLILSKLAAETFGTGLVWIRAVPFFSGTLALAFAVLFARRAFVHQSAQLSFVAAVSLSPTLIFYASEMKQYSTDALVMMVALYVAVLAQEERRVFRASAIGFFAVVSSLPGLFVFGALGLLLISQSIIEG